MTLGLYGQVTDQIVQAAPDRIDSCIKGSNEKYQFYPRFPPELYYTTEREFVSHPSRERISLSVLDGGLRSLQPLILSAAIMSLALSSSSKIFLKVYLLSYIYF